MRSLHGSFLSGIFVVASIASLVAAPTPSETKKQLKSLQEHVKNLRVQIGDMESTVKSLESSQNKMASELVEHESELQEYLYSVAIPLLHWPDTHAVLHGRSWIELQRNALVLKQLRENILRRPLQWRAEREIKLRELQELRTELSSQLGSLTAKKDLMRAQIDELKILDKRERVKRPVRASTKLPKE